MGQPPMGQPPMDQPPMLQHQTTAKPMNLLALMAKDASLVLGNVTLMMTAMMAPMKSSAIVRIQQHHPQSPTSQQHRPQTPTSQQHRPQKPTSQQHHPQKPMHQQRRQPKSRKQ